MSRFGGFFCLISGLLLAACAAPAPTATQNLVPKTVPPNAAQEPSAKPQQPSATDTAAAVVVYDFMVHACEADWTNNGQTLACPSQSYGDIGPGYVEVRENTDVEGDIRGTALLTHPSVNGSFFGIFGAFPPITIESGDQFRVTTSCVDQVEAVRCDAVFSLEYYAENGTYMDAQLTGWQWSETNDGHATEVNINISSLAGQNVRLVLVVRDNGDPEGDYALWVHPQLFRAP